MALERPSWDLWLMRHAYVAAERGSCRRKQVGAVIVRNRDRRIISGGYNGAPRDMPDCLEVGCDVRMIDGRESCVRTIHAESNALDLCGVINESHTLYTTVIPCKLCALRIIQHGITRVVYHEYYESQSTREVADLFARCDPATIKRLEEQFGQEVDRRHLLPRVRMDRLEVPMGLVKAAYSENPF